MSYSYTWTYGVEELAGRNKAWLQNACRERDLLVTGTREDLKDRLFQWEEDQPMPEELAITELYKSLVAKEKA